MENKKRIKKAVSVTLWTVLVFIGALAHSSADWYAEVYGDVGFESIVYTVFSGMQGVSSSLIGSWILNGLLPAVILTVAISLAVFLVIPRLFDKKLKDFKSVYKKIVAVAMTAVFLVTLLSGAFMTKLPQWAVNFFNKTDIYEKEYVDPDTVQITFPEKKRNLIYIYLESMETSFYSKELGGGQEKNCLPELYNLAKNNINFSQNGSVGGGRDSYGSTFTIAAMLSHSAGIPFRSPVSLKANASQKFYNGTTTINDILNDNGYTQAFMVGSQSSYGGRKQFFSQHKVDKIYDLETAYGDNIVPQGYFEWWGMEDKYLFEYAKSVITELSEADKPFAFTALTVDTHHVSGYKCSECGNEFDEQYANVLRCSSKQVSEFVSWLEKQSFFENTTVIITGDHKTMDYGYISRNVDEDYTRRVYNCFINSAKKPLKEKEREFVTLDMFPTTLSAMGCEIEGDRLGLGTDLFSQTPTLTEKMGYESFNKELAKASDYYNREFD